jgi:N-acyl-D-aspartate/D-glutamate deacylase
MKVFGLRLEMRRPRLDFLLSLMAAVAFVFCPLFQIAVSAQARNDQLDLLIKGGLVYDGSGGRPFVADIGIRADRIVFIGKAEKLKLRPARVIDARGLIVAPGFIDPHTHTLEDLSDDKRKSNVNYLMQGVTTVITGNDGVSPFPLAETFSLWEKSGIGTNAALLVGHATIRERVLGNKNVEPTEEQLRRMKRMVSQAMDEGALGLSTGLYYVPGVYARTEEVIELARAAAARGGIYDTHMRDEDSYSVGLLNSIRETIRIGREARIPVHISHIKALGPGAWGKSGEAIRLIKEARSRGVRVTANQ